MAYKTSNLSTNELTITTVIIYHLPPHSHRGTKHLLHHQHLLHLLSGGDCGSGTQRLPLVPTVRVPGQEAVGTYCAPCRGPRLQGPCPHCRRPLHWKASQRHPQPVQAATTPQGQELWWCLPGNSTCFQHTLKNSDKTQENWFCLIHCALMYYFMSILSKTFKPKASFIILYQM